MSLLLRCVARKTQESLISIIELVDRQQAYYAMPLLRPMCEELIFIRFMKTLPREEVDEYLWNRVILDLLKGLGQQRDFFDEAQKEYPIEIRQRFKPHQGETQDLDSRIEEQTGKLKIFGKKHGWGNKVAPTVEHMAKATNINAEYEFFYRATSSAVHANLHHLGRMVWGDIAVGMSITNKNFDAYYRKFALTYGAWLATKAMDEIREEFPEQWRQGGKPDYGIWRDFVIFVVSATRFPPIVTEEELRWGRESDGPS